MPFWRSSLLLQVYTSLLFFYVAVFLSCLFCLCKLSFHFFFCKKLKEELKKVCTSAERLYLQNQTWKISARTNHNLQVNLPKYYHRESWRKPEKKLLILFQTAKKEDWKCFSDLRPREISIIKDKGKCKCVSNWSPRKLLSPSVTFRL